MDTHRPQPRIFAICDAAQCSPDSPLTPAEIARRAGDPHNRFPSTPPPISITANEVQDALDEFAAWCKATPGMTIGTMRL